ncbi:MAG: methyltransferase domain-containing protein, partial [Actinomycetota bacterium]
MSDESADVWDAVASGWDDDPIVRAYAAAAFDSLVALLDRDGRSIEGMVVCDFGCGSGLLTERLVAAGAASIDAVDTSVEMLAQLRAKADRLGWTTVHATDEPPAGAAGHDLVV